MAAKKTNGKIAEKPTEEKTAAVKSTEEKAVDALQKVSAAIEQGVSLIEL